MRNLRYILTLSLCTLSLCTWAQDFARLSERTIMGTARYVGMGGAMTAIGADPSAVLDNVAGLGLYRRPEAMITFDYVVKSIFMAPQASAVFSFRTNQLDGQGVLYHNFMFGYHRVHCFNATMYPTSGKGHSLGSLFATSDADMGIPYTTDRYHLSDSLSLYERGYINEYSLDWAMNISNRWYWGIGLRIQSYLMSSDADYYEDFKTQNANLKNYYNRSRTSLMLSGASCAFATGLIYRPASWMRLGFGIESPSVGHLNTSTSGSFYARTDSLRRGPDAPPLSSTSSAFHLPLRLSASVAFQIKQYALLALQYDFRHISGAYDIHMLKAGVEVVPYPGLYINAGYVFESPFKTRTSLPVCEIDPTLDRQDAYYQNPRWQQYISGAVGYRGTHFVIQAAYQFRMQRFSLYAHHNADPYLMYSDTHRIILSLAWRGRE